jgi:predicted RNA-binding protein YlxR (DUF448 family)
MSRKGHVPLRRCVACRRVRPQAELLRLVQQEGVWLLDHKRRAGGRGFWVCVDTDACWTPKRLGRGFRAQAEAVAALLQEYRESTNLETANPEAKNSEPKHSEPKTPETKQPETASRKVPDHELKRTKPLADRRHNA